MIQRSYEKHLIALKNEAIPLHSGEGKLAYHFLHNDSTVHDSLTAPHPAPATIAVNVLLKSLPWSHVRLNTILPTWKERTEGEVSQRNWWFPMQSKHLKYQPYTSHHLHHTPCWCQVANQWTTPIHMEGPSELQEGHSVRWVRMIMCVCETEEERGTNSSLCLLLRHSWTWFHLLAKTHAHTHTHMHMERKRERKMYQDALRTFTVGLITESNQVDFIIWSGQFWKVLRVWCSKASSCHSLSPSSGSKTALNSGLISQPCSSSGISHCHPGGAMKSDFSVWIFPLLSDHAGRVPRPVVPHFPKKQAYTNWQQTD